MDITVKESHPDDAPHLALIAGCSLRDAIECYIGGKVFIAAREGMPIAFIAARVGAPKLTCHLTRLHTMPFYRRLGVARRLWVTMLAAMPFAPWRCAVTEYDVATQCALRQFGFVCTKSDGVALLFKRKG